MAMRAQRINLVPNRVPVWYGVGALLLAAVLAADAAHTYFSARDELARLATRRSAEARSVAPASPAELRLRSAAFDDAQKLMLRMAMPWDGLFNAIERSGGGGVQVQAIRPNAGTRQLVIAAEARELTAMLNFLTRLSRDPALAHPYIQSHELKTGGGSFPLQFVVVAEWRQEAGR